MIDLQNKESVSAYWECGEENGEGFLVDYSDGRVSLMSPYKRSRKRRRQLEQFTKLELRHTFKIVKHNGDFPEREDSSGSESGTSGHYELSDSDNDGEVKGDTRGTRFR